MDYLNEVWKVILNDLDSLYLTNGDMEGQVINPVCGFPCLFDTACASLVFAVEYKRTKDKYWLEKATKALHHIENKDLTAGFEEPRWDPIDWHFDKGSMFVTGAVLDAAWDAMEILNRKFSNKIANQLITFLSGCEHKNGAFAHNTISNKKKVSDVQNTTAIAYYLMERILTIVNNDLYNTPIIRNRENTLKHLLSGQRTDGFWPYRFPIVYLRPVFFSNSTNSSFHVKLLRKIYGDQSIYFGDFVHHLYIMYFLLKAQSSITSKRVTNSIEKAWKWVESNYQVSSDDEIVLKFDIEPPSGVRFCNFRDTNSYFMILAILPMLCKEGIINNYELKSISMGIFKHIKKDLIVGNKGYSIAAHEGPRAIRQNILPAIWQSSSWKGVLLSNYILRKQDASCLEV